MTAAGHCASYMCGWMSDWTPDGKGGAGLDPANVWSCDDVTLQKSPEFI